MSWLPSADPILGDRKSCDALELIVVPRVRDLGDGFEVRRALPSERRQMVGPFIFFDQMGPAQFLAGKGLDVRPHPHIGLATVTYLFDGQVMHRDSEGNALEITPGAMNLMTAGRGIAHSERTPSHARRGGDKLFGIQSWIALPQAYEETDASFQHFEAADLPVVEANGVWARVIAGSAFGQTASVGMFSDWFYAEVMLEPGKSAPLDPHYEERAIYIVQGEIEIAGESFEAPRLLVFRPGDRITVRANSRTRLMFLGGSALERPRYIWWNFVSSRRERIEQAKEDWKSGRFAPVPTETEFIPLPQS
jgi:redox-sensitive bicupin YhaK (pirin superfamily)